MLQAVSRPDEVSEFLQFTSFFQPHYALGFTQPLIEMSSGSRKEFWGVQRRGCVKANKITAICEPIV
jgi:hypothetical protein